MDIEELKQKYQDEEIYVINSNSIKLTPGFNKNIQSYYFYSQIQPHGYFKLRYECEYNPNVKQIIPYCFVINEFDEVFMTQRINKNPHHGDSRLDNKISICCGGHINRCDQSDDIVLSDIHRELEEEIGLKKDDIVREKLSGLIYDPSDEVGKDHVGLVYIIKTNKYRVEVRETDILIGKWVTKDELYNYYNYMENWSKMVFDNLIKE